MKKYIDKETGKQNLISDEVYENLPVAEKEKKQLLFTTVPKVIQNKINDTNSKHDNGEGVKNDKGTVGSGEGVNVSQGTTENGIAKSNPEKDSGTKPRRGRKPKVKK